MPDYTITVGDVEVTSLSDGQMEFSARELFPTVPGEAWKPYRDQLTPDGQISLNVGSFLLRSQGTTVLVDTGLGKSSQGFQDYTWALLLKDMNAKGIRPEEIDLVVITHLHGDHVGWNLTWDNDACSPTFPNARYWIPRADWNAYAGESANRVSRYITEQVLPLERLGLLELMDGAEVFTGEITALSTPGHTPGHTSILIVSKGERGVILGDAAHVPAQVQEVDWSPRADTDPELSRATRRTLLDGIERDDSVLISGHFPAPGFGRILRVIDRRYWLALK